MRLPRFSPEYHKKSLDLGAYSSWKAFDPGAKYPVDERYAALPPVK